ncbi:MAG: transcription termination factor NusA [Anaerolineae bacterium]
MGTATKNDFLVAITQVCSERNLSRDVVLQAVEQALISAYKRNFGGAQNITAKIDPGTGKARIFAAKTVVDQVHDKRTEMTLDEARQYDPMADIGSSLQIEATPDDFGRIAAQTAKQVVLQRIREAERDSLFSTFQEREGEIVHGTVHSVEQGNITVNLGRLEGILPKSEQISIERYRPNQKIRALITEVNKSSRGPQVVLSRTHRNMLRRLLELEVPEIFNGLVEIKSIAREAGQRSKVAVCAKQDGIDPVGACVGQRGVRIQNVVNELSGEKIDVVEWSPNSATFIANSLSPAKVKSVKLSEDANGDKVATVVVEDKQLSLAIGKEGQNARLAAKLTGWRIDIKNETQTREEIIQRVAPAVAVQPLAPEAPAELTPAEPMLAASELPVAAPEPTATVIETSSEAPVTPAAEALAVPAPEAAASSLPVATAPTAAPAVPAPSEPEPTFEQALAQFEAETEGESDERSKKRKEDRAKRRQLVYDEKLGKVIAKAKHKGRGDQDWSEDEEAEA